MPPPLDDSNRQTRPRSGTSAFASFWRTGRSDPPSASQPASSPNPPLSLEALIESLTPPAVPSLTHARALSNALSAKTPNPKLAILSPVLASLCSGDQPASLQAAGYDILAAYWANSGSAVLTTGDRLSCLSLFLDPTVPWSQEFWESRFKALVAIIHSGAETVGMEGALLRVLRSWIEGAFESLVRAEAISPEERSERQRSVETLTELLTTLVGKPEFVSRLSEHDTAGVLQLWAQLLGQALLVPPDSPAWASLPASPVYDLHNAVSPSKPTSPARIPLLHRRHHSSASIHSIAADNDNAAASTVRHPADIVVDAYLRYLGTRLQALAPMHLRTILPLLFRALAFYRTWLPRVALTPSSPHLHPLEQRVVDMLKTLMTRPYSSSCTAILKQHLLFPRSQAQVQQPGEATAIAVALTTGDVTQAALQTTIGAVRTLRVFIRQVLLARMARAFITRATADHYTAAGLPSQIDMEPTLMEQAWPKDDAASWDLVRFRAALCRAVKAWVRLEQGLEGEGMGVATGTGAVTREDVLGEVVGVLKDVTQALDARGEGEEVDEEEVGAVGDVLRELVEYVHSIKNRDGSHVVVALSPSVSAEAAVEDIPSFMGTLEALLGQDLSTTPLYPVLPSILLSMAEHLRDADTARLITTMTERQSFSPTSPAWLDHWRAVLAIPGLYAAAVRRLTRQVAMDTLGAVWEFVKDIPVYRRPLAGLVFEMWRVHVEHDGASIGEVQDAAVLTVWHILGDEVVLRKAEDVVKTDETSAATADAQVDAADAILEFLKTAALEKHPEDDDTASIRTVDLPSAMSPQFTPVTSAPILSRMQSDPQNREGAPAMLLSMFSSLTTGNSSRSQSQPRQSMEQAPLAESPPSHPQEPPSIPKTVGAVVAIVSIFCQLAFTPLILVKSNMQLAVHIFTVLVDLLSKADCIRARLTILQFLMRLRVDRDHRLYFASSDYDKDGHVMSLATLIHRVHVSTSSSADLSMSEQDVRNARPRMPQERNGRRPSRGRGGQPMKLESRSRSRTTPRLGPTSASLSRLRARDPLWSIPEAIPFTSLSSFNTPSERIISYDPSGPRQEMTLPLSKYLTKLVDIIEGEKEWEILSYVLCHLPTQLANKHLFCGPRSKVVLGRMVSSLSSAISEGTLAASIERWPDNIIAKDAHGLAYHSLTVLISYKRCFPEVQVQHHLVEVFLLGLNAQPATIKCCLHALSLSAFELQPSMTKLLSKILEKLSQIMSNPDMAVHIIDFLAIVGSIHSLHANFTESDYKLVFAVALQYLQYHNRPDKSVTISWALSQHVRIMSYYIVYLWFLAVPLSNRPRHIKYITRQLLLANKDKGNGEVDEPAEVCFDWLARYTYASADPRPANSMLNEIVMNPALKKHSSEPAYGEKTWISGNAVITVRALKRRGWLEVVARRASGLTRFICRAENVPFVPIGDVDPDMVSLAACLALDRGVESHGVFAFGSEASSSQTDLVATLNAPHDKERSIERPDPITGYVWSGSAPSQRRKDVSIDPAYFALQLSSYPDNLPTALFPVKDSTRLSSFCRTLDRMPVIDTHKVGIMYVAPGQTQESEILRNTHGSPAYTRFLEGLARLIYLRGQVDVYVGGLDPDEDGEYAYAWWDDIGQILYHTATLMPASDETCMNKKAHIGNDYVRVVWNDSGMPYKFDTLTTQFQFVNIIIEPHSRGAIAAFSNNLHENEYFKVVVQRAPGMTDFTPIGDFKLISAENLPLLVRQLSLLTDWFVSVFQYTNSDTSDSEMITNWRSRLQAIKRFKAQIADSPQSEAVEDGGQVHRDFTSTY